MFPYPSFMKSISLSQDMLKNATPIEGGIGMNLLKKMGWEPGKGLGKNNEGSVDPLMLELKFDMKGLASREDRKPSKVAQQLIKPMHVEMSKVNGIVKPNESFHTSSQTASTTTNNIMPSSFNLPASNDQNPVENEILNHINRSMVRGQHPVSILQELCVKRKYSAPLYEIIHEDGPAHKPIFLIKCVVNNVEYVPTFSSTNKKQAKAVAAQVCLQALSDFAGFPSWLFKNRQNCFHLF